MARYAQRLRQAQGLQPRERRPGQTLPRVVESPHRPLTTRRATRLVLKRPEHRTKADTQLLAHLESQHGDLAGAIGLAQDFCCDRAPAPGRPFRCVAGTSRRQWSRAPAALCYEGYARTTRP